MREEREIAGGLVEEGGGGDMGAVRINGVRMLQGWGRFQSFTEFVPVRGV